MFTDRLNLPLDSERLAREDQTLSLSGMTWEDYEQLTAEKTNYRISYFEEIITIVSPSLNHEKIAEIINRLIKTYCRKYSLLYFPMGSTTLKSPFIAGKEPDCSFSFEVEKAVPDLAVEVVFSSGSTADSIEYKYLGVKEVWFLRMETLLFKELVPHSRRQKEQIRFYQLAQSKYEEVEVSSCLPNLDSEFLINFINRGLTESPLTIEADFIG